jgi:ribonuclease HI
MVNASTIPAPRWVHIGDGGKAAILIFTDGAALNNGQPDARAGCGIVFDPSKNGVSFRLGPQYYPATSNRAEMLAVINALLVRFWMGEGFGRIVIATDSEYVVRGICEWVFVWKQRNWTTSQGRPVCNKDLWERLIEEVERWENLGVQVLFYLVQRRFNTLADECAKAGAVSSSHL